MSPHPTESPEPVTLRDRWREACWRGDAATELVTLEAWVAASDEWAHRAVRQPESLPCAQWLAAAELERIVRWPTMRQGRMPQTEHLDRPALFARAAGDEVELALALQGAATDRLRSCPDDTVRDEVVEHALAAQGHPGQRAKACLNAAWAVRATQGARSAQWGRDGLALLGPVSADDPRPARELAMHLLQQASEFLPWPEKSVMAQSMLAMLRPGEHPAWRARILRRLWSAAVEHDAPEADAVLERAVAAAIESARGRSMMEVGAGLISAVQFADISAAHIVDPLRRLALAADPRENPLAAMTVKGFLIEVLLSQGDDDAAYSVGHEALATLDELQQGRTRALTRRMAADDWALLWAGLAVNVATAAANLHRHDEAAALADRSLQVHRKHGLNLMAATTALELAGYRQSTGDHPAALTALGVAAELAEAEQDRDLQARALARRPQVVLEQEGPEAAAQACAQAERRITTLARGVTDPLERGLVMWEALDVRRLHAEILARGGDLPAAVRCLDGVADGFHAHGYTAQASEVLVVSGHYLAALGAADRAEAAWRRAIAVASHEDDAWIREKAVDVLASWLMSRSREQDARRLRDAHRPG